MPSAASRDSKPTTAFLSARLIGAALALLIQGALLSLFLFYQRTSLSDGAAVGNGGSEISVSLLSPLTPAHAKKSAAARSHAVVVAKPNGLLPRPIPATADNAIGRTSEDGTDPAGGMGPDPGSSPEVLNFQRQLLAHIEAYRRYPIEARQAQQQGAVELQFAINRRGLVLGVGIKRSSGYPALDREAVATVLRAQPMPTIPSELPSPLAITLPIVFGLSQ